MVGLVVVAKTGGSAFVTLLPLLLIFVVFYLVLIRPQQRRVRSHQQLVETLDPGDEVVTIGGIFGTIVELEDTHVILELWDGTQVKFLRSAISRKVVSEQQAELDEEPEETLLVEDEKGEVALGEASDIQHDPEEEKEGPASSERPSRRRKGRESA